MGKFLTEKEASEYLGLSESDFKKIAEKHRLPVYKIGGAYLRFKLDDLEGLRRRRISIPLRISDTSRLKKFSDKIFDFFYFNDFYLVSSALVIILIYFIFKTS